MKIYIAGKITGKEDYKTDFKAAEERLTKQGNTVLNPAFLPEGFEQTDYHHICMAMIDVCEAVYFLPTWTDSKGAHLEMGYAKAKGKKIILPTEQEKIEAIAECLSEL